MPSLQTRFIALCVLLSTGTAAILGGCLLWMSVRGLRDQAQVAQLALARSLASQVDVGVSQAYQAVLVLSEQPVLTSLDAPAVAHELNLVTSATELLDNLMVVLPDGKVLARSLPQVAPEEMPVARALVGPLEAFVPLKGQVLADIFHTRSGDPAVAIRAPVLKKGKLVAILVGVLYLSSHAIGNLDNGRVGKSGYAFLVSETGLPLVHPHNPRVSLDPNENLAIKQSLGTDQGLVRFVDADKAEVLAAFAKVPSAGWSVVVRQPAKECFEPAARMARFMSYFLIAAILITALVSAVAARRLARSILQLVEGVQSMEQEGDPTGLAATAPGVGELGALQGALKQLSERLRRQVRSREKAHRRALDAERGLQQAERLASVGQLAAGLAHELNNPLTVILGAAQEAGRERASGGRQWLQQVVREVQRCKRLIEELLDFSRPIRLQPAPTALAPLCREAWAHAGLGRHSKARLSLPDKDMTVSVDTSRLKQVLVNLFGNALDAMGPKGVVALHWQRQGPRLRLEIQDSGPGIGKKDPEELFRPFYTAKAGGTGLGLPISRAILQAHGGGLWVEPHRGKGLRLLAELKTSKLKGAR